MLEEMTLCEEVFHSASGVAFADFTTDDHRETWPIRSKRFRIKTVSSRRPQTLLRLGISVPSVAARRPQIFEHPSVRSFSDKIASLGLTGSPLQAPDLPSA